MDPMGLLPMWAQWIREISCDGFPAHGANRLNEPVAVRLLAPLGPEPLEPIRMVAPVGTGTTICALGSALCLGLQVGLGPRTCSCAWIVLEIARDHAPALRRVIALGLALGHLE